MYIDMQSTLTHVKNLSFECTKKSMEFQVGTKVFAARKKKDDENLSTACHAAVIVGITEVTNGGKRLVTVKYEDNLGAMYAMMDTFIFVPESANEMAPTIVRRSTEAAIAAASDATGVQLTFTPPVDTTQDIPVVTPVVIQGCNVIGNNKVPKNFLNVNVTKILGITVPSHVLDRWTQLDPQLLVGELFGTETRAGMALEGVHLKSLKEYTGQTEYGKVPVRTSKKTAPNMGLVELLTHMKIIGRTMRARTKGLMFFFLACRDPHEVVFPDFIPSAGKRDRAPVFSLAEQGRLVGIIQDPANTDLVSALMKKWTREDLDAKAGEKGLAYYWNQLAGRYNDPEYIPAPCVEFGEHVSQMKGYVYDTKLLPQHREGLALQKQWQKLRKAYSMFYARFA